MSNAVGNFYVHVSINRKLKDEGSACLTDDREQR